MIKVFLSHQAADAAAALHVANRLSSRHNIQSYLDVIDPQLGRNGEDLAAYIRREMSRCTQLLAVVSYATKNSQWVPWEIGVATEKDFPLATYGAGQTAAPEFLASWPYLRTDDDIDRYAQASRTSSQNYQIRKSTLNEAAARASSTGDFFRTLRASLAR